MFKVQNGVWFYSAVVARKALPSEQYLEDFTRYVAEMHAVFSDKCLLVLFHNKRF
jgi:hypothetical protein